MVTATPPSHTHTHNSAQVHTQARSAASAVVAVVLDNNMDTEQDQDHDHEHEDQHARGHERARRRALLDEVNAQLLCSLCRGYYIDATTIVECLHSFCRSCIVKHLQTRAYCPVCEMMINAAKPNIKPDKALQDIVYKLVPGLFQREMRRRQLFYASRPGQAASATPEQRGEDTERIIFSPEDVISFSLEYADRLERERPGASSSESGSDSAAGEDAPDAETRRFLQCPAVVNVSHLKKFLAMKYDVDCGRYSVHVLYKKVPLPDYYTLMDIAYIYNWKRNRPMRFFYHVTDLLALRDRVGVFGPERPGARARPPSRPRDPPDAPSPRSDASSGSCSPLPPPPTSSELVDDCDRALSDRSSSADAEKSQFLNSFELTAKSSVPGGKADESNSGETADGTPKTTPIKRKSLDDPKVDESPKRVKTSPAEEKRNVSKVDGPASTSPKKGAPGESPRRESEQKKSDPSKTEKAEVATGSPPKRKSSEGFSASDMPRPPVPAQNEKKTDRPQGNVSDRPPPPKLLKTPPKMDSPAKKPLNRSLLRPSASSTPVAADAQKKSSTPQPLSRPSLKQHQPKRAKSGDPLKSLFDSCNINIPSSLSITLTDQKGDEKDESQNVTGADGEKTSSQPGTQQTGQSSSAVHNYIEILKVPEADSAKKPETPENKSKASSGGKSSDAPVSAKGPVPNLKPISDAKHIKPPSISKPQTFQQTFLQSLQQQSEKPKYIKTRIDFPKVGQTASAKTTETPPEQPQPTIKTSTTPITKPKPVPIAQPIRKPIPAAIPKATKSDSALDLSTPHTPIQSQLGPQQTKALETMQSIANLAKRQTLSQRMTSPSQVFSQDSFKMSAASAPPLRIPIPLPQNKHLNKTNNSSQNSSSGSPKHFPDYFQPVKIGNSNNSNKSSPSHNSSTSPFSQSSQRVQNRSPSSSPKLVIACPSPKSQSPEQKQLISPKTNENGNQSNMISSSQISSTNHTNSDPNKESKVAKVTKPVPGSTKINTNNMRNSGNSQKPGTSGNGNSASDILHAHPQLLAQQQYLRHQLELQTQLGFLPPGTAAQWFNNPVARVHFETFMKNMAHNSQLPFQSNPNLKDK